MAFITFQPHDYFNTKLYTGNGSTQAITGVGFQPDWVWLKDRTDGDNHQYYDVVRGVTKSLQCNSTNAEITFSDGLTAFGTDGFTLGSNDQHNGSSDNFAAWCWRAANAQGSSNTDGSINTTYTSANTTAGFSICKWAGSGANATIGHGLGAVPKMIITKSLATSSWCVYHESLGNTKTLFLESNGTGNTNIAYYNNTSPTSSVFSVGTDDAVNHSGNDMIAYCFAEKKGFSKFGSYTGNGNANGTFVYTGFKPAWLMVKKYSASGTNWLILDSKRDPMNQMTKGLFPDTSGAEATGYNWDFTSNGFKIRTSGSGENGSGATYIYMAFAEEPLVSSNNIPATAR